MTRALLLLTTLVALACGASTELDPSPFASRDDVRDVGVDLAVDRGVDVGRDFRVPPDVAVDRAVDMPRDTFVDAPIDQAEDEAIDFAIDVAADEGPDLPGGGSACRRDGDCGPLEACQRDRTARPIDLSEVSLTCGDPSAAMSDGQECESTADCGRGLCLVADTCAQPCIADRDCIGEERCIESYVRGSSSSLETMRACVAVASAGETVEVRDFDERPRPGSRLFVPGRVRGRTNITIFDGFPFAAVGRVIDEDGNVVFDGFQQPRGQFENPIALLDGLLTVRVPMSSRAPFTDLYQLEFTGGERIRAREIRLSGPDTGSVVDLDVFYFPMAGTVTVGGDRGVPRAIDRIFENMNEILEDAGISIGEVRHHPVVGELGRRLAVAPFVGNTHPNLDEARTSLSGGLNRASVPIFWMREIEGVLGTAGNIPGPWGVHGTIQSGIGFNAPASISDGRAALVLAHELGHFLGLFHTTEVDGSVFDPFADTESCPDTNGDGVTMPSECPAASTNLMFWAGTSVLLTEEQAEIMRGALVVQ